MEAGRARGGPGRLGGGRRTVAALVVAVGLLAPSAARAADFVADLSDHLIAITTAFTGADVLLFGTADPPGSEVAVVVRGPAGAASVRRKERLGAVWVVADRVDLAAAPSFYAVAASKPLHELAEPSELVRHEIGLEHLRLEPVAGEDGLGWDGAPLDRADLAEFRAAFVRGKQREGLYAERTGTVRFLGGSLFRTRIAFPANVEPGTYQVQVFQFVDGRVANAQTSALDISKVGLEAELHDFARHRPALYALASILLAVAAGWTAAAVFRRP